jgi:hypothetical protein
MLNHQVSYWGAGIGFVTGWYFMKPIRQYMSFNTVSSISTLAIPGTIGYFTPKAFNSVFNYDTLKVGLIVYTGSKIVTGIEKFAEKKISEPIIKKKKDLI